MTASTRAHRVRKNFPVATVLQIAANAHVELAADEPHDALKLAPADLEAGEQGLAGLAQQPLAQPAVPAGHGGPVHVVDCPDQIEGQQLSDLIPSMLAQPCKAFASGRCRDPDLG